MEDNFNLELNWRRHNFLVNGRWPQLSIKWKKISILANPSLTWVGTAQPQLVIMFLIFEFSLRFLIMLLRSSLVNRLSDDSFHFMEISGTTILERFISCTWSWKLTVIILISFRFKESILFIEANLIASSTVLNSSILGLLLGSLDQPFFTNSPSSLGNWCERSACAALGCWHKRSWPLF